MAKQTDRVAALFARAREMTPPQREDFLRPECADDVELRREVDTLLDASLDAELYLAGLAARVGAPFLSIAAEFGDGTGDETPRTAEARAPISMARKRR